MLEKIIKLLKKEPNLKAKDIARKLGFDKTEVNSLMYKKKDIFVKDEDHKWSLVPNELEITFAGQWVDCSSFEDSLSKANLDIDSVEKVKFILPAGCKFFIETIARFLALCNQLILNEKEITIDLTNNTNSKAYWSRAGFFDQLNRNVEVLPNRPKNSTAKSYKGNSKNLVEFGAVDPKKENSALLRQLTDTFVSFTSDSYDNPIFSIFAEMIKNVQEHSETQLDGFAALQKYDGFSNRPPHIQVIVSDNGKGIASTLRPSLKKHYPQYQDKTDIELVNMVLQGKQISKHGSDPDNARGLGFKGSHETAKRFNAKYSIRQSNFSLQFAFKEGVLQPPKERTNLVNISGTHISFDFDIDDSDVD